MHINGTLKPNQTNTQAQARKKTAFSTRSQYDKEFCLKSTVLKLTPASDRSLQLL